MGGWDVAFEPMTFEYVVWVDRMLHLESHSLNTIEGHPLMYIPTVNNREAHLMATYVAGILVMVHGCRCCVKLV